MFTAAVTPPMAVAIVMGAFWRRYTPAAAFWTLVGGGIAIAASFLWPAQILGLPFFSLGIGPGGYKFIRAFYGLVVSGLIGALVTSFTRPAPMDQIRGYVIGTIREAMERFKGGGISEERGEKVRGRLEADEQVADGTVGVARADLSAMKAAEGDLLYVADGRWWLGGLRSLHVTAAASHDRKGAILMSPRDIEKGSLLPSRDVRMEKIL
jgi:hypothetical protein